MHVAVQQCITTAESKSMRERVTGSTPCWRCVIVLHRRVLQLFSQQLNGLV